MKIFPCLLVLFGLLLPVRTMATEAAATLAMKFDLSDHDTAAEARLWIPYPLSDRNQLVSDIRVSGDYTEAAVYSDQKFSTPILYARWDKGTSSRKLTLTFHVVRQEVVRKDFPSLEAPWDPADYAQYLVPTSLGPIDGQVKVLADRITRGKTTVLAKAKAIYDWTCNTMYRDPQINGCGIGDVKALLDRPVGKCTDIHSVFVALCRAAGIPAREIFGIRIGEKGTQDITARQHCWAEFYLPGYDWVPVDPSDVLKITMKEALNPDKRKVQQSKKYFWGGLDPYRVKLAMGRDLMLNPQQDGKALNTFGHPYAQIGTTTLDRLDPDTFAYKFTSSP